MIHFKPSPNIAVNVRNKAEATKFYTETLGLTLVDLHANGGNDVELKAGDLTLWLDGCEPKDEEHVGKVFFEFVVEDLEGATKVLLEKGCKVTRAINGEDFRGNMIADPYGVRFHLYQSLKK